MEIKRIDHGVLDTPRGKFYLKTLDCYRRTLRIGQQVKLVMADGEYENSKKRILRGEIKAIYPHVAIVEYPAIVRRCGVNCGILRRESFTLKELMIWNMRN